MLFSVIVPVYNIEKWISKCVESILQQEYADYELILVDDGSTDNSGKICDQYALNDNKIKAFHKKNGGLSDARNYGVSQAQGDYMLFVDGDDYIAEWTLKIIAQEIREETPDIILSEGMYKVYNNNIIIKKCFDKENFKGISGTEALQEMLKVGDYYSAWGKCYRTEYWKEKDFAFKKGRLAEDFQLIDKVILEAAKVSMVQSYYYYQSREGSIMHSINEKMIDDMLLNFAEWKEYFATHDIGKNLMEQMYAGFVPTFCGAVLAYIYVVKSKKRRRWIEEASNYIFILNYSNTFECRIIRLFIMITGIKTTCFLLGIMKRIRLKYKKCD